MSFLRKAFVLHLQGKQMLVVYRDSWHPISHSLLIPLFNFFVVIHITHTQRNALILSGQLDKFLQTELFHGINAHVKRTGHNPILRRPLVPSSSYYQAPFQKGNHYRISLLSFSNKGLVMHSPWLFVIIQIGFVEKTERHNGSSYLS